MVLEQLRRSKYNFKKELTNKIICVLFYIKFLVKKHTHMCTRRNSCHAMLKKYCIAFFDNSIDSIHCACLKTDHQCFTFLCDNLWIKTKNGP